MRLDWIKYLVWGLWLGGIVAAFIAAGGIKEVRPLYLTESGVSIDEPLKFITYYFVLILLVVPPLLVGRRTACHAYCWMAPFMVLGRKLRNALPWPSLRLKANADACTSCKTCDANCPMSLEVNQMVMSGSMENAECILCGNCADGCPQKVIQYSFSSGVQSGS